MVGTGTDLFEPRSPGATNMPCWVTVRFTVNVWCGAGDAVMVKLAVAPSVTGEPAVTEITGTSVSVIVMSTKLGAPGATPDGSDEPSCTRTVSSGSSSASSDAVNVAVPVVAVPVIVIDDGSAVKSVAPADVCVVFTSIGIAKLFPVPGAVATVAVIVTEEPSATEALSTDSATALPMSSDCKVTSKKSGTGGVSVVRCGSAPPPTLVPDSASNAVSAANATCSVSSGSYRPSSVIANSKWACCAPAPENLTTGVRVSSSSSDTPVLGLSVESVSRPRSSKSPTVMPSPVNASGTSIRSPAASARLRLTRNVTASVEPPSVKVVTDVDVFAKVTTVASSSFTATDPDAADELGV